LFFSVSATSGIGDTISTYYWTSLNNYNTKNAIWTWEGTGLVFTYSDWKSTFPSNLNSRNCAGILVSSGTTGWFNVNCANLAARFVCEMSATCSNLI
jgi:hypothetical protein